MVAGDEHVGAKTQTEHAPNRDHERAAQEQSGDGQCQTYRCTGPPEHEDLPTHMNSERGMADATAWLTSSSSPAPGEIRAGL